jgi:hypothetical protein
MSHDPGKQLKGPIIYLVATELHCRSRIIVRQCVENVSGAVCCARIVFELKMKRHRKTVSASISLVDAGPLGFYTGVSSFLVRSVGHRYPRVSYVTY